MDLRSFEALVRRMAREIPRDYLDGVGAIDVSPRTVAHPVHADVFTLGECIPVHGDGDTITSRIVLYHGSFRALAAMRDDFDWKDEAWETLTHELRHHLEWRADADALEEYDWAADQNFARAQGTPFDPAFFLSGEPIAEGVYRVDDDVFLDRVVRRVPDAVTFRWRGADFRIHGLGRDVEPPLFVVVDGIPDPPAGDLVVVLRRRARLRDLFRPPRPTEVRAAARPVDAAGRGAPD